MQIPAARGRRLDPSDDAFGWLRPSDSLAGDPAALRARLEEDGYLYLPRVLDREAVRAGRLELLERVRAAGALDPAHPLEAGVLRPDAEELGLWQSYPSSSERLLSVLRGDALMDLFAGILGGPVRSYDFLWLRYQPRSHAISPHCDLVFMGRGTPDVLTCWTPFGDIPLRGGGLMLLEDSHRKSRRCGSPTTCARTSTPTAKMAPTPRRCEAARCAGSTGRRPRPARLERRDRRGRRGVAGAVGRPLADRPEYRMGDVLIFTMRTVHAGTDNETNRLRLSTDSRYQRADAPIDERWVRGEHGEDPDGTRDPSQAGEDLLSARGSAGRGH